MAQAKNSLTTRELVLCAQFAALIAVGAFIKIPIPVVPFTLQFLFTTLAGLVLGARLGAISVAAYIGIGLLGIPVFAQGGGLAYIFQPTFGYLIGFCLGTYVTGWIVQRSDEPSFIKMLAASLAGLVMVYFVGMLYYYFIANYYLNSPIGVWSLILYGFILAVPGDLIICFVSPLLAKRLLPVIKRSVVR